MAKKQGAAQVYQAVLLRGEFKNKVFCLFDGDDDFSVELECRNTGGTHNTRLTRSKGSPANWLLKPNTFLDFNSCQQKIQEIMAESRCGLLRGNE